MAARSVLTAEHIKKIENFSTANVVGYKPISEGTNDSNYFIDLKFSYPEFLNIHYREKEEGLPHAIVFDDHENFAKTWVLKIPESKDQNPGNGMDYKEAILIPSGLDYSFTNWFDKGLVVDRDGKRVYEFKALRPLKYKGQSWVDLDFPHASEPNRLVIKPAFIMEHAYGEVVKHSDLFAQPEEVAYTAAKSWSAWQKSHKPQPDRPSESPLMQKESFSFLRYPEMIDLILSDKNAGKKFGVLFMRDALGDSRFEGMTFQDYSQMGEYLVKQLVREAKKILKTFGCAKTIEEATPERRLGVILGDNYIDNGAYNPYEFTPERNGVPFSTYATFDTGTAGKGDMLDDLAMSLNSCAMEGFKLVPGTAKVMLSGWNSIIEITPEDFKELPLKGRITEMRWALTRATNFLSHSLEELQESYIKFKGIYENAGMNFFGHETGLYKEFDERIPDIVIARYRNPQGNMMKIGNWYVVEKSGMMNKLAGQVLGIETSSRIIR